MPVIEAASDFLDLLRKSRLFPQPDLDRLMAEGSLAEMLSPQDVAENLISRQLLTRYQAERILAGKRRGYFVDEYKILDILGSGGMGYLYAAEEPVTKFKVALKVLSDRYRDDKGMISRFHLEAEAGMRLAHPNVLRTKAIRRTEDIYGSIHYMVMELVQGLSLYELLALRKRTLPSAQACDVIYQAATGLHHAHGRGLIHRDVKPENLLIRSDGAVKVLDFGLAMIGGSEAEFSMATILGQNCLGTADYIAPEQSIDSFEVDCRADIYGLGCSFYFLLTGRVPFPSESISKKLEAHRTQTPRSITEFRPKTPPEVVEIVEKMMAKKPADRYQTAAEVARVLDPLRERRPIDFDFKSVLTQRAEIALRRQDAESKLRHESRISSLNALDLDHRRSSMLKKPQDDTVIQKDTRLKPPTS